MSGYGARTEWQADFAGITSAQKARTQFRAVGSAFIDGNAFTLENLQQNRFVLGKECPEILGGLNAQAQTAEQIL
jgi:hypothetical protein